MTITPEQFNKLATKDDLKRLEEKMVTKDDINKILTAVDGIAKKHEDFEQELVSNQAAHDRMQGDIDMLKKQTGMAVG